MAAHDSFQVFRRFSNLRTRLLLLEQDRIVQLEQRLHDIDQKERKRLYLGSSRKDQNQERQAVLAEIRERLESYGECTCAE